MTSKNGAGKEGRRRLPDGTELGVRALQFAKEMTVCFALTEQRKRVVYVSLDG